MRLEIQQQCDFDLDGIRNFYELAKRNLGNFNFEDKRLALEALRIKVWMLRLRH